MSKKCFATEPCDYREQCVHAQTAQSETTQYFQPPRTGFFCDHYKAKPKQWGHGADHDND